MMQIFHIKSSDLFNLLRIWESQRERIIGKTRDNKLRRSKIPLKMTIIPMIDSSWRTSPSKLITK